MTRSTARPGASFTLPECAQEMRPGPHGAPLGDLAIYVFRGVPACQEGCGNVRVTRGDIRAEVKERCVTLASWGLVTHGAR